MRKSTSCPSSQAAPAAACRRPLTCWRAVRCPCCAATASSMPEALELRCQLSALLDRFEAFSNDPTASSRLLADSSAWQQAADELLEGVDGLEVQHIELIVE